VISLTYLPHAFFRVGPMAHLDPAGPWEKALELVLYNAVGGVAGYLAGAERQRREELEVALDTQQKLQRQLVRAGQLSALGELVAGVTHEIKTPLHALRGTAEIVDPLIPEDCKERRMWELHRSEIDRLGTIAERFQSFARPQTGAMEDVNLDEVAARLRDLIAAEARKQGIRVELEPSEAETRVHADPDQLTQVGLNIGVNAIRAMKDRGERLHIRVVSGARDEPTPMHALIIDNDGPPIPDEMLATLFDPFVSGGNGTGLGLAIAERIVELHDGTIEAANAGLGVRFSVLIPAAD
jgi:signal transduction histidine kinase